MDDAARWAQVVGARSSQTDLGGRRPTSGTSAGATGLPNVADTGRRPACDRPTILPTLKRRRRCESRRRLCLPVGRGVPFRRASPYPAVAAPPERDQKVVVPS